MQDPKWLNLNKTRKQYYININFDSYIYSYAIFLFLENTIECRDKGAHVLVTYSQVVQQKRKNIYIALVLSFSSSLHPSILSSLSPLRKKRLKQM